MEKVRKSTQWSRVRKEEVRSDSGGRSDGIETDSWEERRRELRPSLSLSRRLKHLEEAAGEFPRER